ncbi:unnamed protein product [Rotaria sp. Silwood1]|nr:unnamed protein product [Rotaria sp. Silwood1]
MFEFLSTHHLIDAFHGLNSRFNCLLFHHFTVIGIDFRSLHADKFVTICQEYVPRFFEDDNMTEEVDELLSAFKTTFWIDQHLDAQSERQTSIYSPPFYSSPNGYKMRARLYLNGDGNARRTYMSLFFVLMRGLNDPILKFPFNYKVIFCLYDQTSTQRHIIDSFRPDIKSSSFQRLQSDMNIASSIPKFTSLEVVQQGGSPYVRDDTLFIKIMVDFEEIHKT